MTDAVRILDPGFRVTDSLGAPISGAKIKFYDAGTTTPRTVYSNYGLSSSLGATVYCGSSGAPVASSGSSTVVLVYTGTTAYKIIITDASDVTLFTFDNILGALDTSTFLTTSSTSTLSMPVITKTADYTIVAADRGKVLNANATGGNIILTMTAATTLGDGWNIKIKHSGTANTVTLSTSQTFAYAGITSTSYVLAVGETVEVVCDAAGFHIVNAIYFPILPPPQGRLTLTSATPVLAADVTAAASVYFTPFGGNILPIWNGARFMPVVFSELTLSLVSSHSASSFYDVFAIDDAGTRRLVTGPVWSTLTAGSGARGTGAGTTQISFANGFWTNTVAMTGRNGNTTYSVSAGYGTYLGSLFIDGSAGQVSCHVSYGQSRKWGVWNAYNRRRIVMKSGDSTASWSASSTYPTFRALNNTSNNKITTFMGLPEEWAMFVSAQDLDTAATNRAGYIAVGVNSTSVASGTIGKSQTVTTAYTRSTAHAVAELAPGIGINNIQMLEAIDTGCTFNGTENLCRMRAEYMG